MRSIRCWRRAGCPMARPELRFGVFRGLLGPWFVGVGRGLPLPALPRERGRNCIGASSGRPAAAEERAYPLLFFQLEGHSGLWQRLQPTPK